MALPTVLSPWFVVQKLRAAHDMQPEDVQNVYFCSQEISPDEWTTDKKLAMLFMSLHSVARVAKAQAGEIRVLVDAADAEEFGRS